MKTKNNKRSASMSPKKVFIGNTAKGLTSQAGVEPVVKFLNGASQCNKQRRCATSPTMNHIAIAVGFLVIICPIAAHPSKDTKDNHAEMKGSI